MFSLDRNLRLIYDGVCNLCTSAVRLVYALDRGRLLEYVPSQQLGSNARARYGLATELLQGRMYLVLKDNSVVSGATAIEEVCGLLSPFGFICTVFKTQLAQRVYDWIAERRYRVFGCRQTCYVVDSRPTDVALAPR